MLFFRIYPDDPDAYRAMGARCHSRNDGSPGSMPDHLIIRYGCKKGIWPINDILDIVIFQKIRILLGKHKGEFAKQFDIGNNVSVVFKIFIQPKKF